MSECITRLPWVECPEPERGLKPRRIRAAIAVHGVYEVFQYGDSFDAWLVDIESRLLVFLGRTQTANGARERCERHARKKAAQ